MVSPYPDRTFVGTLLRMAGEGLVLLKITFIIFFRNFGIMNINIRFYVHLYYYCFLDFFFVRVCLL